MRSLLVAVGISAMVCVVACSSGDAGDRGGEPLGETQEPLVGTCVTATFGHPCDPDGNAGPLLECQGVCWLGTNGSAACVPIATAGITSMDGRVCGNTSGAGSTPCQNSCLNGACIAVPAKQGAACRPSTFSDTCDGTCDGAGTCNFKLANPCAFGRDGCEFDACDMLTSACQTFDLTKDTTCSDGSLCTLSDVCDGTGTCTGTPKNCNDNNVCTTDNCNPANGACIGAPNTNTCSDNNACTAGDTCSAGVCQSGPATVCNDNNACTTDTCGPTTGCIFTPKNCNDNNACTTDSCDTTSGACANAPIVCNDNNACTTDSCAATTGCVFTPIVGCGVDAGTGGTGGTDAATGGTGGTDAATGGTGGTDAATGGTGGVDAATGGTGGADAATGGTAGTATGGTAGTASGGTAGTASGGTAGSSTGGTAGSATGGAGGSTGGSGGSTGGSGGSTGGSGGKDGGTGKPKGLETEDDGGCGCRVPADRGSSPATLLFLAALGAVAVRRRRTRN